MTPQESDLITTLLARLKSTAGQPKDPDADRLIRQAMVQMPDAPYYLVQTVLIQDLSLHQAEARIAELEKQVSDASQSAPTSFLGSLFGRSQPAQPSGSVPSAGPWSRGPNVAPPPQGGPQYAQPGYAQPGAAITGAAVSTAAASTVAAVILAAVAATPPAESPLRSVARWLDPAAARSSRARSQGTIIRAAELC